MSNWKKQFDELEVEYPQEGGLPIVEPIFYNEEQDKVVIAFIEQVEADAYERGLNATKAVSKSMKKAITKGVEVHCMCTPELTRNEAYEKAAKVVEDMDNKNKEFDIEPEGFVAREIIEPREVAQAIRKLKDENSN